MQVLSPDVNLADFHDRLAAARARVLMLDYDGTLAPFRVHPEEAAPYPGVLHLLDRIIAHGGTRVAIVSGRPAREVAALLPLSRAPEIWGAHGWERILPDGRLRAERLDHATRRELAAAEAEIAPTRAAGARIERKPASVALHWRGMPEGDAAGIRNGALAAWRRIADGGRLEILPFDGGIELRARGINKRHAVEAILADAAADSVAAYLGDDLTDEDAFQAVRGRGLAVLVRPELRETAAGVWIRPPEELLEFMGRWCGWEARA